MLESSRAIKKIIKIDQMLAREYGHKRYTGGTDPLTELIRTVLSQNTSDMNRDRAFAALKKTFPRWEDIAEASTRKIALTIKVAGLAKIRGIRIIKLLKKIHDINGEYNLDNLRDWPDENVRQFLLDLKGVGPKTAACVMAFSLGRNVMPVDTHVYRVFQRLGILPAKISIKAAHDYFVGLNDSLSLYQLHLNLIAHGRNVCHARKPACFDCAIGRYCDYYKKEMTARSKTKP